MPELPEVETIVQDLKKCLLNQRVKEVEIYLPKIIKKGKSKDFKKILEGNSFQNIIRRGKFIIIKLTHGDEYIIVHLRMTGQLIYINRDVIVAGGHSLKNDQFELPSKQTHLIIHFQDDSKLFYNDQRQFGYWQIIKAPALKKIEEKLGIEPLGPKFTFNNLQKLFQGRKGRIKPFLLNQKYIAGLGNIYVDESLFQAKVHPLRPLNSLTKEEIKKIHQAVLKILKQAIYYRGTTFNSYRDSLGRQGNFSKFLKVYQKEGEKCPQCHQILIKKIRVGGRGTRYCPSCQK